MLQRLPIALAQVKAGNTSKRIYWTKETTKKIITILWIQGII